MDLSTGVNRLWSFFTKPRGHVAKLALSRTQRRARDLMSIASVLRFCTILMWLFTALALWQASGASSMAPSSPRRVLEHWHMMPKKPFDASTLGLAWLLSFVATMAPIVCLRRLGSALYTQAPLSFIVATRFLWLGRALVANIIIGFLAGSIAASQIKEFELSFSLGFWGTFIAAILAYVVADVIREGARAVEENREFV